MAVVWRIASTVSLVVLFVSLLAWYVTARAGWVLQLSRRARLGLALLFALGIGATLSARMLGPEHASWAAPLGMFGGAVVLGILISGVLLVPVDLARLLGALVARHKRLRAHELRAHDLRDGSASTAKHAAGAPQVPERREFLARAASAGALSLGMGSALYGTLLGRHEYTLETVPIRLAKLPRALDGLTIVQLSDLHVGTFVGEHELRRGLELVTRAKPDLVVLTGDLLDHDLHYAPTLARFAHALREHARYGVFAVPGNHDHYAGASTVLRLLREAGTEVLLNRHVVLGDGGAQLVLAGLDDVAAPGYGGQGPELERAFAGTSDQLPRVLLSHNPAYYPTSQAHADLTLSGHTHGGQITLFINPAELVLRHGLVRGHYTFGESQLYVNRGFGTAGPPARVGSTPEVTRIVLTS